MNKRAKKIIIFATASALAIAAIAIIVSNIKPAVKKITRTGRIEMREYRVSPKIPGRLEYVGPDEGDTVSAGDVVFKTTGAEIEAKVGRAVGAADAAKAQWNMSVEGARSEQIEMAERNFRAAETQYELAEKTIKRLKPMHDEGLISTQEYDMAVQKLNGANELMRAAKAQADMAKNGARKQEKEMAYGMYKSALGAIDEARSYLDETTVRSPIGGICAKRYAEPGELVATGYPVVAIIDVKDAWVELNLPETELKDLQVGTEVSGIVNSTGKTERFKVVGLSPMADYANWRAQNEKGDFDVRSFTVKLRPIGDISGTRPGMTVRFEFTK